MNAAFHLLADPCRLELLRLVWTGERTAGDLAARFRTTFGAVSQHLGRLWRAGLLDRRRDGRRIYYRARREALGPMAVALEAMWQERLGVLKELAEARQRQSGADGAADPPPPARSANRSRQRVSLVGAAGRSSPRKSRSSRTRSPRTTKRSPHP